MGLNGIDNVERSFAGIFPAVQQLTVLPGRCPAHCPRAQGEGLDGLSFSTTNSFPHLSRRTQANLMSDGI
jgi:hypothetical protein